MDIYSFLRSQQSLSHLFGSEHHVQPRVVSITQATELGTLYTAKEVKDLCTVAHEMNMLVHMDGARICNATAALGATREALRSFTIDAGVDVLTFGGTKIIIKKGQKNFLNRNYRKKLLI